MYGIVTGQGYGTHLISATACWTHDVLSGLKRIWLRIIRIMLAYSYPDKALKAIIPPTLL
ncbi:hypothetical protein BZP36_12570 [Raoultella terrigena]|nr:hypothetical protein BZP36_12570 [Raoultella terrigena]HCR57428.1 hypothetical protein [Raoultella sp.]